MKSKVELNSYPGSGEPVVAAFHPADENPLEQPDRHERTQRVHDPEHLQTTRHEVTIHGLASTGGGGQNSGDAQERLDGLLIAEGSRE